MAGRKSIGKKTRFEVFKRDSFKCQYCGNEAPNVLLEIDHIVPVKEGGKNSLTNLITSCFDCNRGKGRRKLSDNSVISKQKEQLDIINKKREQLKLINKWVNELNNIDNESVDMINDAIAKISGSSLNENGRKKVSKWIKSHGFSSVLKTVHVSYDAYYDDNDKTSESWEKAFAYIPKIIKAKKEQEKNPLLKDVYYCRKILINRLDYVNSWQAKDMLNDLLSKYSYDSIKDLCCSVRNWTQFVNTYNDWSDDNG